MKYYDEIHEVDGIKEGDRVVLVHVLEGTVEYVSPFLKCAEVTFKTNCGLGRLPVELKEIKKIGEE